MILASHVHIYLVSRLVTDTRMDISSDPLILQGSCPDPLLYAIANTSIIRARNNLILYAYTIVYQCYCHFYTSHICCTILIASHTSFEYSYNLFSNIDCILFCFGFIGQYTKMSWKHESPASFFYFSYFMYYISWKISSYPIIGAHQNWHIWGLHSIGVGNGRIYWQHMIGEPFLWAK